MAYFEKSPFNRSSKTCRSPPGTPQPEQHAAEDPGVLDIDRITYFIDGVEKCLNEICQIATDGKLNSEQKLRINGLARNVWSNTSKMAVFYQSLREKTIIIQSTLDAQREKQDLTQRLNELKMTLKESIEENCSKPVVENVSFADMVKTNKNNIVRPNNVSSIAIYPQDKLKTSDETKALVQKIICPEQMKLHVRGLRKTRNGGVIISTQSKDDIEKLKQSTQLNNSGLKVEEPNKRKPRIIIIGVPANLRDQDVYDCIYEQNLADKLPNLSRDAFLNSVRLSHKSGKREAQTCNFILEVSATIRKALITQDRVFINWTSCPVRDFTLVTRCFKCHQYGHAAKTCRETVSTCGHCGELGHEANDCSRKSAPPKCATCLRFKKPSNHKTGDLECPAKKMAESRYINSVDYNEGA